MAIYSNFVKSFTKATFLANGSWTVPVGVTEIIVDGCGGGQGGHFGVGGGSTRAGGHGATYHCVKLSVTPGQILNVFIGAGGSGILGGNLVSINSGSVGGDTYIQISGNTVVFFPGAGSTEFSSSTSELAGHYGHGSANPGTNRNVFGSSPGSNMTYSTVTALGGGPGPYGNGGNGLAGQDNFQGQPFCNAAANSGAGAGAAAALSGSTPTNGGIGGSGRLYITYLA